MASPSIQFLGTGTAFQLDGRGAQALLVRPLAGSPFLVDVGPTALAAMSRFGVSRGEIDRLFVTHLHGDHTAGWPFLLLSLVFADRRRRPFDVFGPRGVRACLEGLTELCYREIASESGRGFEVRYHELAVEEQRGLDAGGMAYDVLPLEHHPTSIAYRFDLDGIHLGVTGDTRWCAPLERLARESDVLVVECSALEGASTLHVSLDELRSGIGKLGRCQVVLVHTTDEVTTALAVDPLPRVVASHDGMTLALEAASDV